MRNLLFITLLIALVAAGGSLLLFPQWIQTVALPLVVLSLLLLFLLYRSVIMPAHAVKNGLNLIAAQDFNNRLTHVGELEADNVVKLFNTMIDRLRNERLLNMERENFLQLLVEASPMGILTLDFDNRITLVNPSFRKITGIDTSLDVNGLTLPQLPSPLVALMADVPLGESREIRLGDVSRYRCYHLNFMQSGFNRHFYLLETLTEEVMKAERSAYEKVIRMISHEVNNTMGGVRTTLDILRDCIDNDDMRDVVDSCSDRCEQMSRFINSYADVVRVPQPVMRDTDINTMIREMIPFLKTIVRENIDLTFEPLSTPANVPIDTSLMQQVIVNIVKNAAESIGGDGFIKIIITRKSTDRTSVEVINNGEPITPEVTAQLFSPFFTTKPNGRGLGLTLVREILNVHSATFSLLTGADGLTRFTITLPSAT